MACIWDRDDLPAALSQSGHGTAVPTHRHVHPHCRIRSTLATADKPDYVGFGPIFPTASKADREPAVGVEGLRHVRVLTPASDVCYRRGVSSPAGEVSCKREQTGSRSCLRSGRSRYCYSRAGFIEKIERAMANERIAGSCAIFLTPAVQSRQHSNS